MKTNKTNWAFFRRAAVSAMAVVAMAAGVGLVTAASPPVAEAAVAEVAVAEHRRTEVFLFFRYCVSDECRGDEVCCVWVEKPPKK